MDPAHAFWIVGGLVLGAIALATFLLVRTWRGTHLPWASLPNYYPGARFYCAGEVEPKLLVAALQQAETLLIQHTKWTAANMALVGHHVRIYVADSESWKDLWGRSITGLQDGYTIIVGPSLAALCHELAHLCEIVLDKQVDVAHAAWANEGVIAAIDAYDGWLAKRASVDRVLVALSSPNPTPPKRSAPGLTGMNACRYYWRATA